ncbi:MAG: glycosyltransferase family 4 protein [Gammaproteobacteria bacterium]
MVDQERERSVLHIGDKLSARGSSIHGVGRMFSWWFPVFEKMGYEPKLCVLTARDKAADYLEERGIEVNYLGRSKFDARLLTDLIRIMRTQSPDVVHLHGYGAWTFGRLAARLTGTPVVLHEHMVGDHVSLIQRISDFLLSSNNPTCAISRAVADFCTRYRYVREEDIVVVPNGIPLTEFTPPSATELESLRRQLDVSETTPLIGCVGRLDPIKGFDYLIKAMPILRENLPDIVALIVGDGDQEASLRKLSGELGVSENVRFLGFRKDIHALLALLDVVVIPSLSEGQCLAALEALAMGKPIVSTNVGGLRELFEDQVTALLTKEQDPEDIADKIIDLLADQALRERLGTAARRLASERYDIEKCAAKIIDTYNTTLDKNVG